MCDTFVALARATQNKKTIFAKNSDRQPNEAQLIERFGRAEHEAGIALKCTYISIPQVRKTHAFLISRPYWMWGAEIGVNECGVAIGNETLHSKSSAPTKPALIGMDLVRLGLERSESAAGAVDVITRLLERHGQGGDCGHLSPFFYNNAFIVADAREAFVIETIGRDWMIERVEDTRAISNCFSISNPLKSSPAISQTITTDGGASDSISAIFAHRQREEAAQAHVRMRRSETALSASNSHLTLEGAFAILRDHGPAPKADWDPRTKQPYGLCVHGGPEDAAAQTTGALVAELDAAGAHWVTATSCPCISVFKPVFVDVPLPQHGPAPSGTNDRASLWWRHEEMHRNALSVGLPAFLREIHAERDALEKTFLQRTKGIADTKDSEARKNLVDQCWREASEAEERWRTIASSLAAKSPSGVRSAWSRMNELVGIRVED